MPRSALPRSRAAFTAMRIDSVPPDVMKPATPGVAGFMTSGGTESILMAVKAARERGKAERGITEPEMVIAESAHAAFHKGGYYFGVKVNKTKVRADWRADVDAMA